MDSIIARRLLEPASVRHPSGIENLTNRPFPVFPALCPSPRIFVLPFAAKQVKISPLGGGARPDKGDLTVDKRLARILPRVQKPARYAGGEYNEIKKDKRNVDLRFAFCFPDTYEIGMSNLGFRILYGILNEMPGVWCERVFTPWTDMEEELRKNGIPLFALESGDPVGEFDIIGFSVGYEMAYTEIGRAHV